MIGKRCVLIWVMFAMLAVSMGFVSAVSVSVTDINSTLARVSISSAVDLYAYEVNLDYSGALGTIRFYDFLASDGASTTKGSSTRSSILSVYESRLDNTQAGISGNGNLFNVSHSGDLSLRFALFIDTSEGEEYVYYNASAESGNGGSSSGSGSGSSAGSGITTFELDRNLIEVKLKQGQSLRESFVVTNSFEDTTEFKIDIDNLQKFLVLSEDSFEVEAGKDREINIDFFASEVEQPNIYPGKINVVHGTITKSMNIILEILEKAPLFDVRSALIKDRLNRGEELKTRITLKNIGDLKTVDVSLDYSILDFQGTELKVEHETVGVDESAVLERTFALPADIEYGDYLFAVKLTDSEGKIATSANPFSIVEDRSIFPFLDDYMILIGLFSGALAIAIIILIALKVSKKKAKGKRK